MPAYPEEGALRGGHIPTARSIPWARAAREDGTFKPASELRKLYVDEQGFDPEAEVITYCRIGERSSHTWFVMKYLLGFDSVKNGVTVVVVVSVVVVVEDVVVLDEPHAANDRAIRDTPPARAAFAFFFSQTAANFSAVEGCLLEASISFRNAPVEIMFIFFAPYKYKAHCAQIFGTPNKKRFRDTGKVKISTNNCQTLSVINCCIRASPSQHYTVCKGV